MKSVDRQQPEQLAEAPRAAAEGRGATDLAQRRAPARSRPRSSVISPARLHVELDLVRQVEPTLRRRGVVAEEGGPPCSTGRTAVAVAGAGDRSSGPSSCRALSGLANWRADANPLAGRPIARAVGSASGTGVANSGAPSPFRSSSANPNDSGASSGRGQLDVLRDGVRDGRVVAFVRLVLDPGVARTGGVGELPASRRRSSDGVLRDRAAAKLTRGSSRATSLGLADRLDQPSSWIRIARSQYRCDRVHVVGDEDDRPALVAHLANAVGALLLEGRVADREHLVDQTGCRRRPGASARTRAGPASPRSSSSASARRSPRARRNRSPRRTGAAPRVESGPSSPR